MYFNGSLINSSSPPLEKNGRIYVPLRDITDKIGAKVSWHAPSQNIVVLLENKEIKFRTGFKQAKVNDEWVSLDMPALRINDIIFVPLRFFVEIFGATVTWDQKDSVAYIEYNIPSSEEITFELAHNALLPLSLGDVFTVTLRGPDMGKVFMRVTDDSDTSVFLNVTMEKIASGLYETRYTVKEGDILRGGKLVVTYIDREGNKKFIKADNPVYINTLGPVIKKVFPEESSVVYEDFSAVYVLFDLEEGSLIEGSTVFFSINDVDLSSRVLITNNMILYKLPSPLYAGNNSVKLRVSDKNGKEIEKIWNFWVVRK